MLVVSIPNRFRCAFNTLGINVILKKLHESTVPLLAGIRGGTPEERQSTLKTIHAAEDQKATKNVRVYLERLLAEKQEKQRERGSK